MLCSSWVAGWARSRPSGIGSRVRPRDGHTWTWNRVERRRNIGRRSFWQPMLRPSYGWRSESWSDVATSAARKRVLARAAFDAASLDERTAANASDREAFEAGSVVDAEPWDGPGVHPGRVVATLARVLPREAILTTDAGDFGTWAARGFRFHRPGTFLGSAAGPLGYGLPAAIGAALARPGRLGVALAGDGGFAMTMSDLETAVRERAHVVAVVFDNGRYGTIWRHQADRGSAAGIGTTLGPVDFAAVAEACGALGISVGSDDEFEPALQRALDAGRPALLHLALDPRWTTPDGAEAAEGDAVDLNDKGLVTYDRQVRKDAFYWYKANWTTNPRVRLCRPPSRQ